MPNFDFEPRAVGLSMRNARLLGQAAAVSYEDGAVCKRWAVSNGFDQAFDFIDNADTQGFVAQNDEVILVAFRGTQPDHAADWLSDLEALPVEWEDIKGRAHEGFCQALRVCWRVAASEILPHRMLDPGARAVWITGHSLGGALAALCAAHAHFIEKIPIQGVYTFGQPRVGNEHLCEAVHAELGSRIFRFINNRDIVPRVPLFGMTYRHCGTEIFFDHNGQQENRPSAVETLTSALRLALLAAGFDVVKAEAKLMAEAAIRAAISGDIEVAKHELMKQHETAALGDLKALAAKGIQNITDHNMITGYLPRLGISGFRAASA
jgi:triacylglycerol lipase